MNVFCLLLSLANPLVAMFYPMEVNLCCSGALSEKQLKTKWLSITHLSVTDHKVIRGSFLYIKKIPQQQNEILFP